MRKGGRVWALEHVCNSPIMLFLPPSLPHKLLTRSDALYSIAPMPLITQIHSRFSPAHTIQLNLKPLIHLH